MNRKELCLYRLKKIIKRIFHKKELQHISTAERASKLEKLYKTKMGKKLDLSNPKTFNEKIQWIKLFYNTQQMRQCVDKVSFKEYVNNRIGMGFTAKLFAVWNSPEEVHLDSIPYDSYVIKSNMSSDGRFIVIVKDASNIDVYSIEKEIKETWFDSSLLLTNSFCSAYYGLKPRVLVEEYIEGIGGVTNDYKILCFNGEPQLVYCAEEHFNTNGKSNENYPITMCDLNWNVLNVQYDNHPCNKNITPPPNFDEMMRIARILANPFPFVRVDFYDTNDTVLLSELTFYPSGGFISFNPPEFDDELGLLLTLPEPQKENQANISGAHT